MPLWQVYINTIFTWFVNNKFINKVYLKDKQEAWRSWYKDIQLSPNVEWRRVTGSWHNWYTSEVFKSIYKTPSLSIKEIVLYPDNSEIMSYWVHRSDGLLVSCQTQCFPIIQGNSTVLTSSSHLSLRNSSPLMFQETRFYFPLQVVHNHPLWKTLPTTMEGDGLWLSVSFFTENLIR